MPKPASQYGRPQQEVHQDKAGKPAIPDLACGDGSLCGDGGGTVVGQMNMKHLGTTEINEKRNKDYNCQGQPSYCQPGVPSVRADINTPRAQAKPVVSLHGRGLTASQRTSIGA